MKNLLFILLTLGVLVINLSSCKKKYSGCCKYTIEYNSPDPNGLHENKDINQCESDITDSDVKSLENTYNNYKLQQSNSYGTSYQYTVSGEGCSFHKGKH